MADNSKFLYLTDLHLVSDDADDEIGDYSKSNIIPSNERTTKQRLLRNTLDGIPDDIKSSLKAVIINGDISERNGDDGYIILSTLLETLVCKARSANVVVVPGNHDITRDTLPSSIERYQKFHTFVKKGGYIAPALEGIDIDQTNGLPLDRINYRHEHHFLLDDELRWAIIPINCANYYGSLEPLPGTSSDGWQKLMDGVRSGSFGDHQLMENLLVNLHRRDAARVSDAQMAHVDSLIKWINQLATTRHVDPQKVIKIGIVHHHLLPVSDNEEVKPYEALINLEAFRRFLQGQDFRVVLHGHKHTGYSYWDKKYDSTGSFEKAKPILILSGSSIRNPSPVVEDACRLIILNTKKYLPSIEVRSFPLLRAGYTLEASQLGDYPLFDIAKENSQHGAVATVIEAHDATEVYERLKFIFRGIATGTELHNVICHIHNPQTVPALIDSYPPVPDAYPKAKADWFNEIISWWQQEKLSVNEGGVFNHGTRILRFDGHIDQLDNAKTLLKASSGTSRAIISLLDPRFDAIKPLEKVQFPSLSTVQFVLRPNGGTLSLDCVGYFRKQETRSWWPINVAELSYLQQVVFDAIYGSHSARGLALGTITTIAAVAVNSVGIPRVAVPAVDRALDLKPDELWRMVFALYTQSVKEREKYRSLWIGYLDDLVPPERTDEDGVPIALDGLRYLQETAEKFDQAAELSHRSIVLLLKELLRKNQEFANNTSFGTGNRTAAELPSWRNSVASIVREIKDHINQILGSP